MFADIYLRKPEKSGFLSFIPTTQISINISLKSKATGVFTPVAALLFDVKGLPFIRLAILQTPCGVAHPGKTHGRIEQADWQMLLPDL